MNWMEAVQRHHQLVEDCGFEVVMTVLIGSQNYNLNTEVSDVDTFSFVLPSLEDLALAKDPASGEWEVEDGKCMYKDIRLALNLLKKTSPNSVECFVSKMRVYNPRYKHILNEYLDDPRKLSYMIHCNYTHMLYAMAGMAHQLTKRNMPPGKRYSHALRLKSMSDIFVNSLEVHSLLKLTSKDFAEAYTAKRDTNLAHTLYYDEGCLYIATQLDSLKDTFKMNEKLKSIEAKGLTLVNEFQTKLISVYLGYMVKKEEY